MRVEVVALASSSPPQVATKASAAGESGRSRLSRARRAEEG
ncbi:MAG: hypothetical protein AVDCRST_MAG14-2518 [uncultured Rubrobacteraceae bacterium]|uniref:Uncharacterized protein n=1 Tax=uncultured Rubrobacteraceae bacterium TaxID=349277 RepID=A0A6J4R6D0_9ACTN|nr:MAG: hypothetical protein AVDCRST_MAG14-2518 [uncultured Rubrobacteraceae bacterium]